MDILQIKEKARIVKEKIGLNSSPVGVKFIFAGKPISPKKVERLSGHRYCQALMKARHGEHVLLDKEGISCPAAASAFGFRPLPEGLKNGKGLVGFGITKDEETGMELFRGDDNS